jgi:hypothetical protein
MEILRTTVLVRVGLELVHSLFGFGVIKVDILGASRNFSMGKGLCAGRIGVYCREERVGWVG